MGNYATIQTQRAVWQELPASQPGATREEVRARLPDLTSNQWDTAVTALRGCNALVSNSTNPRRYWRGPCEPPAIGHNLSPAWQARLPELSRLWDEGMSRAEIGRRLGVSDNAVGQIVRRAGLRARPSPIVHAAAPQKPTRLGGWEPLPAGHPLSWQACVVVHTPSIADMPVVWSEGR